MRIGTATTRRWLAGGVGSLVVLAIASPVLAASPGGQNGSNPFATNSSSQPSVYTLQGDATNSGTGITNFISSGGGSNLGTWYFSSSSTVANTSAIRAYNFGSSTSRGIWAEGQYYGLIGENANQTTLPNIVNGAGVFGFSPDSQSNGIAGEADTGTAAYAVWGISSSGNGVVGQGPYYGVWGYSTGTTGSRYGVYGQTASSNQNDAGVYGYAPNGVSRGVVGVAAGGIALGGFSTAGSGFYGSSASGPGGVLRSTSSTGVTAYTQNSASYAIVTGAGAGTYGNVYVAGRVTATGGCCTSADTSQGPRQMYANESTQNIFSDQGTAQLVGGKAYVKIDSLYAQTVNLNSGYQVFVTPGSPSTAGLAVVNKTATSFEVIELNGGTGNFSFDWRIDAVRSGYESVRMAPAQTAPAPLPGSLRLDSPDAAGTPPTGTKSTIEAKPQVPQVPVDPNGQNK